MESSPEATEQRKKSTASVTAGDAGSSDKEDTADSVAEDVACKNKFSEVWRLTGEVIKWATSFYKSMKLTGQQQHDLVGKMSEVRSLVQSMQHKMIKLEKN